MGSRRLKLYLHLVWGTWDGNPWIIPRIERSVYRCIVNQIKQLGCEVIAINGIADHIHLVVRLKSTVSVALLVKKTKGVSARFINQFLDLEEHFKWRAGYGGFTISRWDLPMIINYVKNQKTHHDDNSLNADLEAL